MRVVKEHNERKNEILDAAEMLFSSKGYEKCTVNDILKVVGIAKGTFYHYFKSKEEVLDAIIERVTDLIKERADKIMNAEDMAPEQKLLGIFLSMNVEQEVTGSLTEELHKTENALMHQKSLSSGVMKIAPMLAEVVEEGVRQGDFQSEYPLQYMQIFLTSASMLLDEGVFQIEAEEKMEMLKELLTLLAKMLGVPAEQILSIAGAYLGG